VIDEALAAIQAEAGQAATLTGTAPVKVAKATRPKRPNPARPW